MKLHRQIRFTLFSVNESSELNDLSPSTTNSNTQLPSSRINQRSRDVSYRPHSSFILSESPLAAIPTSRSQNHLSTKYQAQSTGMVYDDVKGWSVVVVPSALSGGDGGKDKRSSAVGHEYKLQQVRAMQKLERDLIIVSRRGFVLPRSARQRLTTMDAVRRRLLESQRSP